MRSSSLNTDVLVIGAGAAGLSAAETLRHAGIDTIVLEARGKIGGRIDQWPVWLGRKNVKVQSGAEFIHWHPESSRVWRTILKENEFTADDVEGGGMTCLGGTLLHDAYDQPPKSSTMMRELQEAAGAHFEQGGRDMRVQQFLDTHSLQTATDAQHRALLNTILANEYGEDQSVLSLSAILEPESYSLRNYRIREGFGAVIRSMAKDAGTIRTGNGVKQIRWRAGRVMAAMDDRTVYGAERCIVTVPVGMLQRGMPSFDPALPQEHLDALRKLVPGRVTKVLMEFRERFWSTGTMFIRGGKGQLSWPPLLHEDPEAPYVSALVGGQEADILAEMTPGRAARRIADDIMGMYGVANSKQMFINGMAKAWHREPHIRTAYSSPAVGAGDDVRRKAGAPVADTLFFAGEAVSPDHPATVTGAIETGRKAAEDIIALQ